jgi:hypothetical protein
MSYTRPDHDAADASWSSASAYTRPAYNDADGSWAPTGAAGTGAGEADITGGGVGAHGVLGVGAGDADITGSGVGLAGVVAIVGVGAGDADITGAADGAHGVRGAATGETDVLGEALARHGVRGAGAGEIDVSGSAAGLHLRYELRGEVRLSGVLVNRRVRAYRRDTGALVGEADTVAGRFRVNAGVGEAREHYVIPIDMSEDATDWLPPAANRIVSVLANDAA